MNEFFTWELLATYSGACVATGILVEFLKGLLPGLIRWPDIQQKTVIRCIQKNWLQICRYSGIALFFVCDPKQLLSVE